MKRYPLYGGGEPAEPEAPPPKRATRLQRLRRKWSDFYRRRERTVLIGAPSLLALAVFGLYLLINPPTKPYTQDDINAAVAYALKHRPPEPSRASVAAEVVRPSVVRVTGYDTERAGPAAGDSAAKGAERLGPETDEDAVSVGSGVIIDEQGTILTNLHVASGARRLKVTFSDGSESDAYLIGAQPEDDLAVIRPDVLPDDLKAATLVSTRGMKPGDEVVAVGFPFAIGPSVSSGVVSGLGRSWASSANPDKGGQNLIQFDAAANPGNPAGHWSTATARWSASSPAS